MMIQHMRTEIIFPTNSTIARSEALNCLTGSKRRLELAKIPSSHVIKNLL